MKDILMYNGGLWINILIPIAIGIYLKLTNKEYSLKEFGIQSLLTIVILTIVYGLFFRYTTDLYSNNYYNSYVKQFEHYHAYTETHTSTDSKGRTTTTTTYHDDEYYVVSGDMRTVSISSNTWKFARNKFKEDSNGIFDRTNNIRYTKSWGGSRSFTKPNLKIPISVPVAEINYVRATANNIVKATTFKEEIDLGIQNGTLVKYPLPYKTNYGKIKIHRVLTTFPFHVRPDINQQMDNMAAKLGPIKEVNPLIYMVTGVDRSFTHTLKSYWKGGRKNDAILVLCMNQGRVEWSDTIAWTKNADFTVNATKIYKGKSIAEVIPMFESEIRKHFDRTEMKEYKFLEDDLSLTWWAQLIIVLLNLGGSAYLFYRFLNNRNF